ncbi:MAG TPA: hypothetical protein VI854_02685, partial [Acidimicrobiia bacterium]|nr:hypothetical protein [Acidimicrobiia bacterium]
MQQVRLLLGFALLCSSTGATQGCFKVDSNDPFPLGIVVIVALPGLTTSESGATATFTVVLGLAPAADVTVPLASSDPSEGTVPASIVFTPANWNVPQAVTVTGFPDDVVDGTVLYTITVGPTTSPDFNYTGVPGGSVDLSNTDTDVASVNISPTSGLLTDENGGTATFEVVLTSQPSANVLVPLSSSDTGEGLISVGAGVPAAALSLTFTPADWNLAQTVIVTGQNDPGAPTITNDAYSVDQGLTTSGDLLYNGLGPASVSLTNSDNDTPNVLVNVAGGVETSEANLLATDSFTVVLTTVPTADVVVLVETLATGEGLVSAGGAPGTSVLLTFTAAAGPNSWDTPHVVTVTPVNDSVDDDDQTYTIRITIDASNLAAEYATLNPPDVGAVNLDDDTAGFNLDLGTGPFTVTEGIVPGGTFTLALTSIPTDDVTVEIISVIPGQVTRPSLFITFLAGNPSALTPVPITVSAFDDVVVEGSLTYADVIEIRPDVATLDLKYLNLNPPDVTVTVDDNDIPGILVNDLPSDSITTSESGAPRTIKVTLASIPSDKVVIAVAKTAGDMDEGTVAPPTVTFDPLFDTDTDILSTGKLVTVTPVDDILPDGPRNYTLTFSVDPTTVDLVYLASPLTATVVVTNSDDETSPPGSSPTAPAVVALAPTAPSAWDDKRAVEPSVLLLSPTSYVMWYEGSNGAGQKHEQVGRATWDGSLLTLPWTKSPTTAVLTHTGVNATIDKAGVGDPSVMLDGITYKMWFGCRENAPHKSKIAYATSTDGITWVKYTGTPDPTDPTLAVVA